MKSFEYHLEADKGQLLIDVPEEMIGKKLKVLLMEDEEGYVKRFDEMPVEERLKVLEQYKGIVKYPDFPIDKYDVYDQ